MERHEPAPGLDRAPSPSDLSAALPADSAAVTTLLRETAALEAAGIVAHFYEVLSADAAAAAFLSHDVVQARLKPSLVHWLTDLMAEEPSGAGKASDAEKQRVIGEIHARIRLPAHLMLEGAMVLKAGFAAGLRRHSPDAATLAAALASMHARMDTALYQMVAAYVVSSSERAQAHEAFRLFAAGPESALDRESQRAALMEWLQGVLSALLDFGSELRLHPIRSSAFGLWVTHRAGVIFQGLPGLEALDASLTQIDRLILPQLGEARDEGGGRLTALVGRLNAVIDEIKFLLNDLFQIVAGNQEGRDPLTRTLNRRFLSAVLGRETAIAQRDDTRYALLMLDVDHFKQINDRWGHTAGDAVLRDVAEILLDGVRLSDFVFRYGGEEFLLVLIESGEEHARVVAERLRLALEAAPMRLPDGSSTHVTASIGLAVFDGHPDYAALIERADAALYVAKRAGRNRVQVAAAPAAEPG